jgi:hypothetical protein
VQEETKQTKRNEETDSQTKLLLILLLLSPFPSSTQQAVKKKKRNPAPTHALPRSWNETRQSSEPQKHLAKKPYLPTYLPT